LKDDWVYLRHILDEIEFIRGMTENLAYKDLIEDKVREHAITRSLEIIGEAAKNVSDPLKTRFPDIPWREMAGLRDRIIHGYFDISYDIVWDVIINRLPEIQPKIQSIYDQIRIDSKLQPEKRA
jgi:uncharacterized protein with HEPN domain